MLKSKNGFTLLESIFAIAIVGSVLAIVLSFMARAMYGFSKAKNLTIATQLARKQLEYVKNIKFPPTQYNRTIADTDSWSGNLPYDDANFDTQIDVTDVYADTNLNKVEVKIYKDKTPSNKTDAPNATNLVVTLTTYIARNGI